MIDPLTIFELRFDLCFSLESSGNSLRAHVRNWPHYRTLPSGLHHSSIGVTAFESCRTGVPGLMIRSVNDSSDELQGRCYRGNAVTLPEASARSLVDYTKQTGIDLASHPIADSLRSCGSTEDVLKLLEDKANQFKDFRDGNRKLINWLSPVVQVVHTLSTVLGASIALVPFEPAKAIFASVDVLIAAASGVSSSYDALVDLFECLGNFMKRLRIYTDLPLTPSMTEISVKIMVELLSVLALATKQIKQGRFRKFAKKLLGETEIEGVLRRLDRLTQEEGRMTMAQTLEVVYGLVNNVKVVINGTQMFSAGNRRPNEELP
ncbi:hypothetical protein BJY52DRAFT_1329014 [Lactarius psammicola]|nr:hypothetical protein BJY52DRAFT_1329014 [Lactarius psammicola]